MAELRTSGGVTRLAMRYKNGGTKQAESDLYEVGKIALVDVKSKKKHLPIKDANGSSSPGRSDDEIGGGRIYVMMQAGQEGVAWAYFDALPAGTVVSVEVPQMFPFEDVVVTEGPGTLLSREQRQEHRPHARSRRWCRPSAPTRRVKGASSWPPNRG